MRPSRLWRSSFAILRNQSENNVVFVVRPTCGEWSVLAKESWLGPAQQLENRFGGGREVVQDAHESVRRKPDRRTPIVPQRLWGSPRPRSLPPPPGRSTHYLPRALGQYLVTVHHRRHADFAR